MRTDSNKKIFLQKEINVIDVEITNISDFPILFSDLQVDSTESFNTLFKKHIFYIKLDLVVNCDYKSGLRQIETHETWRWKIYVKKFYVEGKFSDFKIFLKFNMQYIIHKYIYLMIPLLEKIFFI